jgi:hypothetical protein
MLSRAEETRLVGTAKSDLEREFPEVPAHQIEVLVARLWAEFIGARIRDFVPVLVRTAARDKLRATTSAGVTRASRSGAASAENGTGMDSDERTAPRSPSNKNVRREMTVRRD